MQGRHEPDAGGVEVGCAVAPMCSDNIRGTWRLATGNEPAGYFFTFDGSTSCNGSPDAFLLDLTTAGGECDRNGDCTITEDTRASFDFSSDNLGGSFTGVCGDPSSESMQVDLARSGCDAVTYQLVVHDSAPSSVFDLALVATRCRCDIGWDPCVDPLPADPCAP